MQCVQGVSLLKNTYSVRLSVRTTAFQVVKTGSIPVLSTKIYARVAQLD